MKVWTCLLGMGLLLFLLGVRLIAVLLEYSGEEQTPEPEHIPVIEVFTNVWIMEADEQKLQIFRDGVEETRYFAEKSDEMVSEEMREQIADVELTDGLVTAVNVKQERIHGKVMSAGSDSLELEGYGIVPLAADYKGYRIFNELVMCRASDLPFGYDFADFCIENGAICGILMVKEAAMEEIRVLLKTSDYAETLHKEVTITSDCDFTIEYGPHDGLLTESLAAGTEVVLNADSAYFTGDRVKVTPSVLTGKVYLQNVSRNNSNTGYRGHLELLRTDEGIAVVNQLLLEEYLYSVVPSEMPSSYPMEALKAQAICARTYAYGRMLQAAYPQYGAHVDDSTSFQVYNNITEQESTTTAVKETYGQLLLTADRQPAAAYYYSTSCGAGTNAGVWGGEGATELPYLKGKGHNYATVARILGMQAEVQEISDVLAEQLREEDAFASVIIAENQDDFEANEAWYRWNYEAAELDRAQILKRMQARYEANKQMVLTLEDGEYVSLPIKELKRIEEMYISRRGSGGVAEELVINTGRHTYKILTEYNIRYVLCSGRDVVIRRDGSESVPATLLPSAFFILEAEKAGGKAEGKVVGYKLTGGGFGHGVGMSQNGAKNMASAGYTAGDILRFYYEGCSILEMSDLDDTENN